MSNVADGEGDGSSTYIGQEAWPAFSAVASPPVRYAITVVPWETLLGALKNEMRLALVLESKRG